MPREGSSSFTFGRFTWLKYMNPDNAFFGALGSFFFLGFLAFTGVPSSFTFCFFVGVAFLGFSFFSFSSFSFFRFFLGSPSPSLPPLPLSWDASDASESEEESVGSPPSLSSSATKSSSSDSLYTSPVVGSISGRERAGRSSSSSSLRSRPWPAISCCSARLLMRRPLDWMKAKKLGYSARWMLRNWCSPSFFITTRISNVLAEVSERDAPCRSNSTSAISSYGSSVGGLEM
mmetsp:Transcript_4768/g.9721  ORF Transcript_4768/g.9721 Transcript_4768/m.9721 type:complete len:232 (-) Transcript_4768:1295-1990(-)